MHQWRLPIAVTLGLVWYFTDCGRAVTQYFICFLFCLSIPLLFGNNGRESGTQTDEETKEFECAYARMVLPWYGVPEPCEHQPLHRVLSREFDFVIDRLIERSTDFDVCQAVVGSIRILTQHLHNAKQPDELLFSSSAVEMAVLRELSDALVRNLFPTSLWRQEINHCALNEIIALKGNRIREGWSKFVDKMKSKKAKKKKMKKVEQDLIMTLMAAQRNAPIEDDASSRQGSFLNQDDSEREDSDLEDYLASVQEDLIEFKLSYEMWRVGRWTVVDWEDEELIFTVHLEEKDSPENLQWDIKKTYMDVVYFRNRWQLQELVSDSTIGHSQPVFQFLCPLDKLLNEEEHYEGVWGLLSGLAYFLTPGHEEEEQQEGSEGLSRLGFSAKPNKKEKAGFRMSAGANKTKGKETQGTPQRGDESQRGQVNWEQLEATKAIFDLLKEISNSILINIFDAILKPVMPILKKVNAFLNKMNPTEEQMTAYIDTLRGKLCPEAQQQAAPPRLPRSDEEKKETKDRAHDLINARSNYLVLKKTDVESVFNIFQNCEENKTLVYTLLSFLLREFLPNEHSL
uniref:Si:rp71-46j2.7 n=1 Tax=Kryptolebias marmoratus TaxID=37003 RepID=A0A3Q3EQM4_KRYMA